MPGQLLDVLLQSMQSSRGESGSVKHGLELRDFRSEALWLRCKLLPAAPKQRHHVARERLALMTA